MDRHCKTLRAVLDHRKYINATSHTKDPLDGVSSCTICETCSVMISSMSTCSSNLCHSSSWIQLHQCICFQPMKMKMMLIILANINCTGARKYIHNRAVGR